MYESPLTLLEGITKQIMEQRENGIYMQVVEQFGVEVDKEELIRALQYDRDQYNKGYRDGKAAAEYELVRCKDCKHYRPRNISAHWEHKALCCARSAWIKFPEDGFCSYGERKEDHEP